MKRQSGFTVIELMVVAAIVAVLLSVGVPSYKYITTSYRMSSEVNGLLGDLMYARGEAIKEGQDVTVCISTNSTGCTGSANWQGGWIIFSNPTNTVPNPVAAGTILRVQTPFTGNPPDTFVANSGASAVTFNREGFATAVGAVAPFAATLITLHNPAAQSGFTRCLSVSAQGLLNTETAATSIPAGACL
jgi:type IV fimbrial biogenesis protein FimT